jgi:two-component sensor histidine kinase
MEQGRNPEGRLSPGSLSARFARLSTGLKMLLILSLGLFPLGLIAVLASVESARQKGAERGQETLARLEIKAQRLNSTFSRSVLTISTASTAISLVGRDPEVCSTTLHGLERGPTPARYALYASDGHLRCMSPGFELPRTMAKQLGPSVRAEILPDNQRLRLWVFGENGLAGVAEYPRDGLARLSDIPGAQQGFDLELRQGDRAIKLRDGYSAGPFSHVVRGSAAVADGQLRLNIELGANPIGAADMLTILLPVLMWLFAALIGWGIVERYLLRPLSRMERAVAAYKPGQTEIDLPRLATPAREINELGAAFDKVVKTVARHEAELEAAVERQKRLVREVHHRVKNNLQVVASLLNLHSRGSPNEEVAAAYASIQRRVDALAVVHRNHYAELEENRGVALKPLISELAANLRATAPRSAANMMIRLDLEPYYVNQDVAVSVAFLVTEMVEYGMFCGAPLVTISLADGPNAATATLSVLSDSLQSGAECEENLTERFERIVTGLSRQLRSQVTRDHEVGRYTLDIGIVQKGERSDVR